jgi:hypothetical protein
MKYFQKGREKERKEEGIGKTCRGEAAWEAS